MDTGCHFRKQFACRFNADDQLQQVCRQYGHDFPFQVSDGVNSGTGTVAAGSATVALFTAGSSRTLTATYQGDANFNASPASAGAGHLVNKANTTVTITSDTPDHSNPGRAVSVNYSVSVNSPGAGTPAGNVNVSDGVDSSNGTVAGGAASITLNTSGDRTLTATYQGDANYNASPASAGAAHHVNIPPTVSNVAKSTNEDVAVAFAAADFTPGGSSDPEGVALATVRITSLPANGVLIISGSTFTVPQNIVIANIGNLTHAPNLNYNGPDNFGWNGSGGILFAVSAALVNVTVNAVNNKPTFTAVNPPAVDEDAGAQSVVGWVTNFSPGPADEVGQTVVAYTVSNVGTPGLFSAAPSLANNGTLSFTPAANANGFSTFTVRVQDSGGTSLSGVNLSDPQTFTITVNAVNDNPVANPDTLGRFPTQSVKVPESVLVANDTDPEGNTPLTIIAVSAAASGLATVSRSGGTILYLPNAGFTAADSFTYTLSDGQGGTTTGTITVALVNDLLQAANITKMEKTGDVATISFAGIPGRTYTIQSTENLTTWNNRTTVTADAQGKFQFIDGPVPVPPGTRYYRSVQP